MANLSQMTKRSGVLSADRAYFARIRTCDPYGREGVLYHAVHNTVSTHPPDTLSVDIFRPSCSLWCSQMETLVRMQCAIVHYYMHLTIAPPGTAFSQQVLTTNLSFRQIIKCADIETSQKM